MYLGLHLPIRFPVPRVKKKKSFWENYRIVFKSHPIVFLTTEKKKIIFLNYIFFLENFRLVFSLESRKKKCIHRLTPGYKQQKEEKNAIKNKGMKFFETWSKAEMTSDDFISYRLLLCSLLMSLKISPPTYPLFIFILNLKLYYFLHFQPGGS